MARIFITGSSDGLGLLAARKLLGQGHDLLFHARHQQRAEELQRKLSRKVKVVTGDLSDPKECLTLSGEVNRQGAFDVVIHNAGVYRAAATEVFAVNTLAPYILTALIHRPQRLIYLSSGMHMGGSARLECFHNQVNRISYSDTKLHVLMLAKAITRLWPGVHANGLDPGWVPTKMGGAGAPDDLEKGYETQVWLATSEEPAAKVSGKYFFHKQQKPCNPQADDIRLQEKFLQLCAEITGIQLPS